MDLSLKSSRRTWAELFSATILALQRASEAFEVSPAHLAEGSLYSRAVSREMARGKAFGLQQDFIKLILTKPPEAPLARI